MDKDKFTYDGRQAGFVEQTYSLLGNPDTHENFYQKYITIWMSRECNSKCRHCYQKGDPRGQGWSYEQADAVTDLFLKDGYIVHPIVNEWLPRYWDFLKIKKKCGSTEITTNGILITSRAIKNFSHCSTKMELRILNLPFSPKNVTNILLEGKGRMC